jgi:hypothetical protein
MSGGLCIPKEQAAALKQDLLAGKIKTADIAKMLPDEKAAVKAILEDIVTEKLGVRASSAEIKRISTIADKIDAAQIKLGDDLGAPGKLNENLAFFKAKKEMDDYLGSLNPSSNLRVASGTIGRGMMLASVKSPVLNIGSNIEIGFTEGLGRRIASGTIKGADSKLAKDYIKMVNTVYQKTGYDLSRMTSLVDSGKNGERVLDDTVHAQGKGAVRKVGRGVEDVVFKQLMGAPDVVSGAIHFADSVNLNAVKLANGNKAKASEYMRDAMRIDPKTEQGIQLRDQGILDAQVATWTNKSWASSASMGVRKILNDMSGDARLGDFLLPFVKTPANVISTGLDYAGFGALKAMKDTVMAVRTGNLKDRAYIQGLSRNLVRSGLGLTAAVAIAANLDENSFVGAYDPQRAQIEALKNSRENSIKIGNKWISTDWFGPLAVPLNGIMYARKYGNGKGDLAYQYAKGSGSTVLNLPGIKDVTSFSAKQKQQQGDSAGTGFSGAVNYATSQAYSRLVPSVLSDIAKATDSKERVGNKGIDGVKAKLPYVRSHDTILGKALPVKKDVFGNEVKTEPGASTILFGSRVKTDKSTAATKEITRVDNATGKSITFTDWDKASTKELMAFKQKLGPQKFEEAKTKYGQTLQASLNKTIARREYKQLDDDQKLKVISDADSQAKKKVFEQYSFKYKAGKSSTSLLSKFR